MLHCCMLGSQRVQQRSNEETCMRACMRVYLGGCWGVTNQFKCWICWAEWEKSPVYNCKRVSFPTWSMGCWYSLISPSLASLGILRAGTTILTCLLHWPKKERDTSCGLLVTVHCADLRLSLCWMWWGWATSRFEEMISARNMNSRSEPGCRMGRKAARHESWSQDIRSSTLSHRQDDSKLWTQKGLNNNLRKSWLDKELCRSLHLGDQTLWAVHGYTYWAWTSSLTNNN